MIVGIIVHTTLFQLYWDKLTLLLLGKSNACYQCTFKHDANCKREASQCLKSEPSLKYLGLRNSLEQILKGSTSYGLKKGYGEMCKNDLVGVTEENRSYNENTPLHKK